jgi:CRISPR-associated protein Cas6
MYWQEKNEHYRVTDDVIEVIFKVVGKTLSKQYEELLAKALYEQLPWLRDDESIAVFLNHALEEGNGWYSDDDPNVPLYLSRRTKLYMRIPSEKEDDLLDGLQTVEFDIDGHQISLKHSQSRLLSPSETLYAKYLLSEEDEEAFLQRMAEALMKLNIPPRRLLCGKEREKVIGGEKVKTRSLMVNDLEKDEAVRLQQHGIGPHRHIGCGIFVPYKSIS